MFDVAIIGGGASGIIASISAKKKGYKVLLLEKNNKLGKKVEISGNGRGNFTNLYASKKSYNIPFFAEPALNAFSSKDTLDFFYYLGLTHLVEGEGRCYPYNQQASAITNVLAHEINRLGIDLMLNCEVLSVEKQKDYFKLTSKDNQTYETKNVIIATGGITYPVTGSTGDGYLFARSFNHEITNLGFSLTKLILDYQDIKTLFGIRFTGEIKVLANSKMLAQQTGDIIFTKDGISGLAVFMVAKTVGYNLEKGKKVFVSIQLSSLSEEALKSLFKAVSYKSIFDALVGLINKKMILPFLKYVNIKDSNQKVLSLKPQELEKIIKALKGFVFEVKSIGGIDHAQITTGGVDLSFINHETLESKIVKGLYFCGEVLNIDGISGGYNMQWAFSSGYLAGLLLGI